MLSIEECRKILHDNGEKRYTDEELKQVRKFLYELAELVKEQLEFEEQTHNTGRMMTKDDKQLIERAKALVGTRKVKGGAVKEVGCVLVTGKGEMFSGVSLHLACGIGFCAEHTAISQMITQTDETHIKTIVATNNIGAIPPCGRCRELMNILDSRNMETEIIISNTKKVKLRELLPFAWEGD